jgi:hypothetical protein
MDKPTGYPGNLTPEQNKVFADFKTALSRRFSSPTYDDIPIALWGVSLPRRTSKGEINPAQEAILLKFLRDARWNPNEAASKLAAALKWRVDFKLENLNKEKWSEELSRACYSYGVDRLGNPILYTNYSLLSKLSLVADPEKFLRWRVHVLEKALSKANFEQGAEKVTQIFDWSGVGLFLDSKISESNNRLAAICRSYYPECFEYKAQVNVSGLKEFLINIGNFFAPLDNSKNIAITPQNLRQTLLEIISPDSIIPEYNGFDPLPSGTESIVLSQNVLAGKTFSHEVPATKGDIIEYSYICKQGDITGSYGFKKEGKKFLDDKNQIAKKESGKGTYEVERKGAFVLSFANEDPNGSKDIYFRAVIVSQDDSKTERKKSRKDKKEDRKPSKSQKAAAEDEGESEN